MEKNQRIAFERSFDLGFGTETDVRDDCGQLVISHDMPRGGELALKDMLHLLKDKSLPLAINIKADGLARAFKEQMDASGVRNWFAFDMSVPEMVQYLKLGLPVYTRASEFERSPPLYDRATGVWLDAFESLWFKAVDIRSFLGDGKSVCIVSPELHGRDHHDLWTLLRDDEFLLSHGHLILCTDLPEEAKNFLGQSV